MSLLWIYVKEATVIMFELESINPTASYNLCKNIKRVAGLHTCLDSEPSISSITCAGKKTVTV